MGFVRISERDALRFGIREDLNLMHEYLKESHRMLDERVAAPLEIDPQDMEEASALQWWQEHKFSEEFPRMLRESTLIFTHAYVEAMLKAICVSIAKTKTGGLSLNDLSGSVIERVQTYIKKVQCLPFPDTSREWAKMRAYQRLRDSLVHREGEFSEFDKKSLGPLLDESPPLIAFDGSRASPTFSGCDDFLLATKAFFENLLENVGDWDEKTVG